MKANVEVSLSPWTPPKDVYFEGGGKLPIGDIDQSAVHHLIRQWLDQVCEAAGVEYDFRIKSTT